jgi:hypothetical protein
MSASIGTLNSRQNALYVHMDWMYQTKNGIPSWGINSFRNLSGPTVGSANVRFDKRRIVKKTTKPFVSRTGVDEGSKLAFRRLGDDFLDFVGTFLRREVGTVKRQTFDLFLK